MKQLPHFNSIRKKVIFLDLIFVFPLFVLFCILMSYVFEDSNYKLNNSKLSLLEEKCSNIANRNTEIIKISVGMYL
ncbi:sensor histidine kinase, partial [Anaerotignum faecicola]|nr:sensor histidine kinase [Anaerotignum faecicola]